MQPDLVERLTAIVGPSHVVRDPAELTSYQYDGSADRALPDAVVFPADAEQVRLIVEACREFECPFVARGAGTGLSGGALAEAGGVLIVTSRLRHILELDVANRLAVVEPGVVNAHVSEAAKPYGLHFVPDPSSQGACSIGGNVAENSGGLHCLAYGVTAHHVLGCEVVTPDGDLVWLGGKRYDEPGYDLLGVFVGSEGTLGIATKVAVKLTPLRRTRHTLLASFTTPDDASRAVSEIIASGVVPAALEMMDGLSVRTIEDFVHAGLPVQAGAVLLVDVEDLPIAAAQTAAHVRTVCERAGADEVRQARTEQEAHRLWLGRKSAFGAMGRLSASYYVADGVIPRTKLPQVLGEVARIGERYGLRIANVFHAGDGNLHPLIAFDDRTPGEYERTVAAAADILRACVRAGGSITGEHGVGVEKRDCMTLQFSPADLALMSRLKAAFNPDGLCNPGKIFPTSRRCGESARIASRGGIAPDTARAAGAAF